MQKIKCFINVEIANAEPLIGDTAYSTKMKPIISFEQLFNTPREAILEVDSNNIHWEVVGLYV